MAKTGSAGGMQTVIKINDLIDSVGSKVAWDA